MGVNDRGTIKWTAMMLPEHVEMVKQYWKETEYKAKPILDEQQKMEINAALQCALHNNLTVEIKFYNCNERDFHIVKAKLQQIDPLQRIICLENNIKIKLFDVLDVYID